MKIRDHTDKHLWRCMLAALLLALATTPFTASAACTGKLEALHSYTDKYLANDNLLDAPALATVLGRLPGTERLHLARNLDVSGPIQLAACHLVVSGNAPHMGTEQDAMLDVDLASGTVIAAIHGGGRIDIYVLADAAAAAPRWEALPGAVREWAVKADMGFPSGQPRSLAQPRSVRLHAPPPAPANAVVKPAAPPVKVEDDVKPNPAQIAAIRRAAASGLADCKRPDKACYSLSLADLNDDGRPDLLVSYLPDPAMGGCGTAGCGGVIVMATANGYAGKIIELPYFNEMEALPSMHHGMHDLQFDRDSPVWKWNGKEYDVAKTDLPGSNAPAWVTRQAAGHPMMAVATPIDSTIKNLLVFCEQGTPLLAMVTKAPRSAGPVTLTFVFRGWTVNVPMQHNSQSATLWVADLSGSDLPQWLAHRGNTATKRELARLADQAFLRINGGMEGEISLKNSTAATQAALAGCYRY